MSALKILILEGNKLLGHLLVDLSRGMPSLEEFYCGINNLSVFISTTISNSSRLTRLDLSNDSLTGPIRESFGNIEYLTLLNLQENNFYNDSALNFLTSLTNCRKLIELKFYENLLDGATTGFDESDLLGMGASVCFTKGNLKDDTLIAAKIFNMQLDDTLKSFDTGCKRLNIMIDEASTLDYLHNGFSTPVERLLFKQGQLGP
ncbi:hypothetical protein HAX54_034093 [Datura stramonium]|uniref:Uncharacterized protein n=1 Tax=Datura stramonium TaxID=4076 RepID=A0ABS8VFL2_DATST|nr:hypothetical protein [Datura stramonium]